MIAKGADRQHAYRLVQSAAKRAWGAEATFREALASDGAVAEWLSADEIDRAMDLEHHLAGIRVTYRALGLDEGG
jgi:adenylosuccinate lyase